MKKDTSYLLNRAERFRVVLIGEGMLVGAVAGLIVLFYRLMLSYAGDWLHAILAYARTSPLNMFLWFVGLMLLATIVGLLVKWEPMISGSGIPQLEGEMAGRLDPKWYRVLPAKFLGGFLSLLAGLSLGREGPSIQLGAMTGKGVSRMLKRGRTEEKYLLTCGASAGLAAAFHAPLAGVMFSLEEVHKNFSVSVLISVMASSITADFMSSRVFGTAPVFQFDVGPALPQSYYGALILLGVMLGVMGAFYNWFTLKMQSLYKRATWLNPVTKVMIPFLLAGVLGFTMPDLLGSGHNLIDALAEGEFVLTTVLFLFVAKFLFSGICFGSGAPGGIFFPLLVLGAMLGGAFGLAGVQFFGLDPIYVNRFVVLAMAGYFTAIVRAPLTGIILIFEMTGSLKQMLSMALVSIVAYVVASLLKSEPIYESLLERLLHNRAEEKTHTVNQKMLSEYVIEHGSVFVGKQVKEISWPKDCLLVAIRRGEKEIIPRGDSVLQASDMIVVLDDEQDFPEIDEAMKELCSEQMEIS